MGTLILKALLVFAACLLTVLVYKIVQTGRYMDARKGLRHSVEVERHHQARRSAFTIFIFLVALVLGLRLAKGDMPSHLVPLYRAHMTLDGLLVLVTLVISYKYTGATNITLHKRWVYGGFIPLFTLVLVSGIVLTIIR